MSDLFNFKVTNWTVQLESKSYESIKKSYNEYLKIGFVLVECYVEKKYRFFGEKTYYVSMVQSSKPIDTLLKEAIEYERYEEAMMLREIKDKVHELKFK